MLLFTFLMLFSVSACLSQPNTDVGSGSATEQGKESNSESTESDSESTESDSDSTEETGNNDAQQGTPVPPISNGGNFNFD